MDRSIYEEMASQDSTHWWYCARRDVLSALIARRIAPPPGARILEIGCGTGHNLPMLARFGRVDAVECDAQSRAIASQRLGRAVHEASLPDLKGLPAGDYDLIALLDVLEHITEDRAAMSAVAARLAPGGHVLLTVPQYPWMWSDHDVANHHARRYTATSLAAVIEQAGLTLDLVSSFNSLLFPLAVVQRFSSRLVGGGTPATQPATPVNALFRTIFGLERYLLGRVPLPPGLSLVAVLSLA